MFDEIVITAANEAQAAGYREQIAWRRANGFFDAATDMMVVTDPGGRRVGSLGATLNVLVELTRKAKGDPFTGRRILICHSGGDSRRTPAYAALGKAFTPLPCVTKEGRPLALFDLIVREADRLPAREGGQLIVLSGDVLVTVDPSAIDFSRPGLTGVAWWAEMATGSRHGVYVPSGDSSVSCCSVKDFLQKPSSSEATTAGATDQFGRVAVDTGILSLDPSLCHALVAFALKNRRWLSNAPCLDIYEHFTYALVGKGEERLVRAFHATPFQVNVLQFCEFFHIGSSRELLRGLTEHSATAVAYSFHSGVWADVPGQSVFAFNSCSDAGVRGHGCLVEGCWLAKGAQLGASSILTGVPRSCTVNIHLPKETGLVCLPVGEKEWTAISYRLDDNFKTDGKWEMPLWHVGAIDDAVVHALDILRSGKKSTHGKRRSLSLASIIPRVNHARLRQARSEIFREVARRRVAEDVSRCVQLPTSPRHAVILPDQVVWVTSPVRIDFAGGWSDTPPICLEQGGSVLNAAVTLNGQYPIQVMAKLSCYRRIRISSIDLGDSRIFTNAAEIQNHSDPNDWCAIPKAALILAGIVPSQRGASLGKWLATFGGGLDLTIFSALPKGSGMETSSILGATVLACLDRLLGIPYDAGRIIRMTSVLEQRMQTGGGWQDQIGGLLPGVKLITTSPGLDQTPVVRDIAFDAEGKRDLTSRCLLYYTGYKRLARNILDKVVNRYVLRSEGILDVIAAIKHGALLATDCLARHDVEGFEKHVREYWELKKHIDPGVTNAEIEKLISRVQNEASAVLLPGAGGGGFLLVIAHSAAAARRMRAELESDPPNAYARVFDFDIDHVGMKVTVL